jgi:hypothetical protein
MNIEGKKLHNSTFLVRNSIFTRLFFTRRLYGGVVDSFFNSLDPSTPWILEPFCYYNSNRTPITALRFPSGSWACRMSHLAFLRWLLICFRHFNWIQMSELRGFAPIGLRPVGPTPRREYWSVGILGLGLRLVEPTARRGNCGNGLLGNLNWKSIK